MELEDYLEPEIAITAAVTAAVFSPQARKVIRRGAIYGIAGALIVGDTVTSFARNIGTGFKRQEAPAMEGETRPETATEGGGGQP
ncbi:MAG: hypothetical protein JOZ18_06745 [Chloroflexi bacterium]|nr:hypothetical protein [Chloroflexota bacterium]